MKTKKAKKEQAIRIFESVFKNDIKEPTHDEVFEDLIESEKNELMYSKDESLSILFEHEIELDKKGLICLVCFFGEIDPYELEIEQTSFMLVSPSGDTLPDYTKFDL